MIGKNGTRKAIFRRKGQININVKLYFKLVRYPLDTACVYIRGAAPLGYRDFTHFDLYAGFAASG